MKEDIFKTGIQRSDSMERIGPPAFQIQGPAEIDGHGIDLWFVIPSMIITILSIAYSIYMIAAMSENVCWVDYEG